MSAYKRGYDDQMNRDEDLGIENPFTKPQQAWLAKEWERGVADARKMLTDRDYAGEYDDLMLG